MTWASPNRKGLFPGTVAADAAIKTLAKPETGLTRMVDVSREPAASASRAQLALEVEIAGDGERADLKRKRARVVAACRAGERFRKANGSTATRRRGVDREPLA